MIRDFLMTAGLNSLGLYAASRAVPDVNKLSAKNAVMLGAGLALATSLISGVAARVLPAPVPAAAG